MLHPTVSHLLALCFVIEAHAQPLQNYLNAGMEKNKSGQYREAIEDFDYVISLDSKQAPAYRHRGYAKSQLHQLHSALEDYNQALSLDPNNAWTLAQRGVLKIRQGAYSGAVEDLNRSILLNPQDALNYVMRAEAKYKAIQAGMGRPFPYSFFEVVSDYSRAIALDERFSFALRQRGSARLDSLMMNSRDLNPQEMNSICEDWQIAASLGDQQSALFLKQYCEEGATAFLAEKFMKVAQDLLRQGRSMDALERLEVLLSMGDVPASLRIEAILLLGELKAKRQDFAGAIQEFTQVLAITSPNCFEKLKAYYLRGFSQARMGKYAEAILDFDQAINQGYTNSWAYLERANAYQQLEQSELACEDWKKAQECGNEEAKALVDQYCKSGILGIKWKN